MISIEAHRVSIGRFSGKARFISLHHTWKNIDHVGTVLFIFLLALMQIILYGLVFTTVYVHFDFIIALLFIPLKYGSEYWIVKHIFESLCDSIENMAQTKLMRNPTPPSGNKAPTLIPCSCLDTLVLDGRCKFLSTTSVLDGGNGEPLLI